MSAPILQTRLEYYNSELEKKRAHDLANLSIPMTLRKEYPMPEILMEGVVVGEWNGSQLICKPTDYNHKDVRLFDPETGRATPWVRPEHQGELQLEWDYRYAKANGV